MEKIKQYIIAQMAKEPEAARGTLQEAAKRLLIGFFVLMLLLTGISRAADSVTVARVKAARIKSGVLNHIISGEGAIEAEAERYLGLYEGARVLEIAVKEGQQVEEGELLFTYDLQELENIRENLQRQLIIAKLSLEKERLAHEPAAAAEEEQEAQLLARRAELDVELARLELEEARAVIDKAKREELEAAKEAYGEALAAKSEPEEDRDREVKRAEREVSRAEDALEELYADKKEAEAAISKYRTAVLSSGIKIDAPSREDTGKTVFNPGSLTFDNREYSDTLMNIHDSFNETLTKLYTQSEGQPSNEAENDGVKKEEGTDPLTLAQMHIFWCYYGEEQYKSHAKEARGLLKNYNRAREDYQLAFITAAESGGYLTTAQKAAYIRAYEDTYEAWKEFGAKDRELYDAISAYGAAIQSGSELAETSAYETLLSLICREDEIKRQAIRTAKEQITAKQENLEGVNLEWDRKLAASEKVLNKAEKKMNQAQEVCNGIQEKRYDYGEALRPQESRLEGAERALEDAEKALNKARKNDSKTVSSNRTKEKMNRISDELLALEVEKQKKAVDEVEELLKQEGQVFSPAAGRLRHIGLSVGGRITGSEKVSISMEDYGFRARVSKDDVKHLAAGDEISIRRGGSRKDIMAVIESVGQEDSQGMTEITAVLPKGDYTAGEAASYTVNKTSKQYRQTLPLQAVRMDSNQVNYVLIIGESNTSLGKEQTAWRVNVEVLEKDSLTAAVDAPISPEDRIIIGSSKSIEEGDRVRSYEENE